MATWRGPAYSSRASPSSSEARYPSSATGIARIRVATAFQSSSVSEGITVKMPRTACSGELRLLTARSPSPASWTASSAVSRSRSSRAQRRSSSLSAPGRASAAASSSSVVRFRTAVAS